MGRRYRRTKEDRQRQRQRHEVLDKARVARDRELAAIGNGERAAIATIRHEAKKKREKVWSAFRQSQERKREAA